MLHSKYSLTLGKALGKTLGNVFWENTSLPLTNEKQFRSMLHSTAIDFIAYHSEELQNDVYMQVTSYLDSLIQPAINLIVANCKSFDASRDFDALKGYEAVLGA